LPEIILAFYNRSFAVKTLSPKEYELAKGAAILLSALHLSKKIGKKSLEIKVSGASFNNVKLPDYLINIWPAPQKKQRKASITSGNTQIVAQGSMAKAPLHN
jgi:hypothetical protein